MADTGRREAEITATMAWLVDRNPNMTAETFNRSLALVEALTPTETPATNEEGGQ